MKQILDSLAGFAGLDDAQRGTLAKTLRERTLDGNAELFAQGEAAAGCFVVLAGQVIVTINVEGREAEQVASLGRGELFGEVALIDGRPRSATCTAGPQGARVGALSRADFDRLFKGGDSMAHALMDIVLDRLVGRLRGATRRLLEAAAE